MHQEEDGDNGEEYLWGRLSENCKQSCPQETEQERKQRKRLWENDSVLDDTASSHVKIIFSKKLTKW